MTGETKRAWRRAWFQIHKWIGLASMIVLIPLSLSGSALVWDDALDHALHPSRTVVSGTDRLPPSRYVAAARGVLAPDDRIVSLRFLPDGPVLVTAAPAHPPRRPGPPLRTTVWLDPPDARVIDHAAGAAGLIRVLHGFHGSLLVPGAGRAIVGWLGVAMALSCLSGLWLWWPAGRLMRAWGWRRGDRRLDTNLHHQIGFWIALPLALLSVTGAWIAWPQMIGAGGPPRRRPPQPAPIVRLDPDRVLAIAASVRAGVPAAITWPVVGGPWRVEGAGAAVPAITVDDGDGATGRDATPARPAPPLLRRLHDGTDMGPVWRTLIFLGGLAPAVLGVTGITMWLRSRRWRKDARPTATRKPAA